jgi:uncharacterized protein YdeI (YjbR/CyaY-like superfamily)
VSNPKSELPLLECADLAAWRAWLHDHHADAAGVWLKFAKKNAPHLTVTQDEAIDEALCFGWIDGQVGRLDEHYYRTRFTPRTRRSRWSLINTQRVQRLSDAGRMQPAGHEQVQAAKADGRWDDAYSQAQATVPDDFAAALAANPAAKQTFEGLSSQNRFAFIFRLGPVKTPEGRAKRIAQYIEMLTEGRAFH